MTAPLLRRSPVHDAVVLDAVSLTPRMRRVTLAVDALRGTATRPAQDVELLLREASGRRVKRRYTIRAARPAEAQLDLDVLLHGHGPGSLWGQTAAPGDAVQLQGPRGKLELRAAPVHLLVGDESALPAICTVAEALPATERAIALVEVSTAADELPVGAAVTWVHRGGGPPGEAQLLTAAVTRVLHTGLPAGTRAYLLGESRAMITLRGLLENRGIEHDAIFVKGYWNTGRPDRLAGRAPAG